MDNALDFDTIAPKILKLQKGSIVKIFDADHEATFMARYNTAHYPDDEYIKLFFTDKTILEIMPSAKELFFCDDLRREADRSLISEDGHSLNIDGHQYLLENGDDTQFVKEIYFGSPADGEEGCTFSDYSYGDEVWSLAMLDNGEISDVHARKIEPTNIIID